MSNSNVTKRHRRDYFEPGESIRARGIARGIIPDPNVPPHERSRDEHKRATRNLYRHAARAVRLAVMREFHPDPSATKRPPRPHALGSSASAFIARKVRREGLSRG